MWLLCKDKPLDLCGLVYHNFRLKLKDSFLALWLEYLAAIHSAFSLSCSSSSLECELAGGNRFARELWIHVVFGTSTCEPDWYQLVTREFSAMIVFARPSSSSHQTQARMCVYVHMCACVCISVCVRVCVFVYECRATVGHLDAALCHPLVALLCFAQEMGRGEDVWWRAGGCAWWARHWAQCLQRVVGGHQLASSPLLGDTWKDKEREREWRKTESSKQNRIRVMPPFLMAWNTLVAPN